MEVWNELRDGILIWLATMVVAFLCGIGVGAWWF